MIQHTKHFNTYNFTDFDNYKKLLKTGIYELYAFDGICIVCEMPKVFQDEQKRLHNPKGPAAIWRDGFEQYFIHGRAISGKLFDGFSKRDFLSEQNEDTKAAMYEIIEANGEGSMLEFLGAEEVDKHTFIHTVNIYGDPYIDEYGDICNKIIKQEKQQEEMILYKTKETFAGEVDINGNSPCPLSWLKMTCPSTGSNYLIPTDSSFNNCIDAAKYHRPSKVPAELDYVWNQRN